MMKKFQMNLFEFSHYRGELMGVATLLIILCHTTKFNLAMPTWLYTLLGNGGTGVDMFLFLSGMGIFNSYCKRKNDSVPLYKWFWRRYLRIIVPCAFFIIPIVLYQYYQSYFVYLSISDILLNLSGWGFLFGRGSLWFVTCILILYVLTPLLHSLLVSKNRYMYALLFSLMSLMLGYIHFTDTELICKLQFMFCRFPCYFIGYAMGVDIFTQKSISIWYLVMLPLIGYVLLFLSNHIFRTHFSYFWIQGIFLVSAIAMLIKRVSALKCLLILKLLGTISLESYAANIMLLPFFIFWDFDIAGVNLNFGGWSFYVLGTSVCLVVSYIVNKLSKKIIKRIA